MYVEYSKIEDNVFVTDDKGVIKRFDNTNNFDNIIMLENERFASEERIDKERINQKKFIKYRNFICGLSSITLANTFASIVVSQNNVSAALTGGLLISSFVTVGVMQSLVKSFDKNIKNINIYQKALDKELKFELSKSKRVIVSENERGVIDNNRSSLRLTYDKYELMHQSIVDDYNTNGKITFPLFEEREKRIFKTMLEEETKKQPRKIKVKEF